MVLPGRAIGMVAARLDDPRGNAIGCGPYNRAASKA